MEKHKQYLIVKVDDVYYTVDSECPYDIAAEIIEALQPTMGYPHTTYILMGGAGELAVELLRAELAAAEVIHS